MITTYGVLGQECPSVITEVPLYAVPTGKSLVVSTIHICNVATIASDTEARYDIILRPSGASLTLSKHYIFKNVLLRPGEADGLTTGDTLGTGDSIYVVSSVADTLAFAVSGALISEVVS
jgi:hypothetical protein